MKFELCAHNATPARTSRAKIHPTVFSNTGSKASLSWVQDLLGECKNNHPRCVVPGGVILPGRLLDLTILDPDDPHSSNINLSSNHRRPVRYVCLSYCWGDPDDQKVMLQKNNHAELTEI